MTNTAQPSIARPVGQSGQSVRWMLKAHTKSAHQALHLHPLATAVVAEASSDALKGFLSAHLTLFHWIEHQRNCQGLERSWSLGDDIDALHVDLSDHQTIRMAQDCPLTHPSTCLGALYVAFGSQFGRAQIAADVTKSFADAPMTYLTRPIDTTRWRALLTQIERLGSDQAERNRLRQGATAAFCAVTASFDQEWAKLRAIRPHHAKECLRAAL